MNNLMLSFSGADLVRLRGLVGDVAKQIALVPGGTESTEVQTPRTALDLTWSRLVETLDLGTQPEMRICPECQHECMLKATRCGHCWVALPTFKASQTLAA